MRVNYQNLTVTVFNGLYRGIGQSFIHTMKELVKLGVDPYLIRMTAERDSANYSEQIFREYGVKINPVEGYWKWVDCCNMERHTHFAPFDSFIPGGIVHTWDNVPAKTRSPQIVTVHDTFLFAKKYKKFKDKFEYLDEEPMRWFMQYVDIVVCPSHFSADDFREEFPAFPGEVHVIPWGSKFDDPHITTGLPCRQDLIPEGEGFFLYVSAPEARKNFDKIVWAFSRSTTEKKLVVVADLGIITPSERAKVEPLLQSGRIHFVGKVNELELKLLYSRAEALVMTSALEGFGMPVVEAASLGCPVIASNTSSMNEFEFTHKVRPDDTETLTDYFDHFKKSSEKAQRLLSIGMDLTQTKYSYSVAAKEYNDLYRRLSV